MNITNKVYVLEHLHILEGDRENVKRIGVYSSREAAEAAINRVCNQPGFRDFPNLINPLIDDNEEGFYIDAYELDKDHWTEGFVTVVDD